MVRALIGAGAAVDAPLPSGTQPIDQAARRILPATVASMVELGADPGRGLDALLSWWAGGAKFADTARATSPTSSTSCARGGHRDRPPPRTGSRRRERRR